MKKIIIVGVSGCGKTTAAIALGKMLNIPSYDLDEYYWKPNWQPREKQEFTGIINNLIKNESWIISGNFSNSQQSIWLRCDTIIWLDYSFYRCLIQAFKRSVRLIFRKESCCNGNYETVKLFFSRNSIIAWIFKSYNKRRLFYNQIFNTNIDQKKYIRFHKPEETKKWLLALRDI